MPHPSRNLLANAFNCDCRLVWLGDWLRSRKIVTGNPRCQRPAFLKEIPLQDVALPDFRCEEGERRPAASDGGGVGFCVALTDMMWPCSPPPQVRRRLAACPAPSAPASAPAWTLWCAAAISTCRVCPGESPATSLSCECAPWGRSRHGRGRGLAL